MIEKENHGLIDSTIRIINFRVLNKKSSRLSSR